jgi:sugar transferase (PEP-CTERM/EpsH1 system associated)
LKILFITPRIPYPINKGDKLRAYHFLRILKKRNEIILFSLDYENLQYDKARIKEICNHFFVHKISKIDGILNLILTPIRKLPFQVSLFYSKKIESKVREIVKKHSPGLIFCQLIRTAPLGANIEGIPKILDYVDTISEGLNKRKRESNLFMSFFFNLEYKKVKKYEKYVFDFFDKKIIITEHDKKYLPVKNKKNLYVIPNGVDTDYFSPVNVKKEYDLLFTGNLSYRPNVNAVEFLAKNIIPIVKKKYPNIRTLFVGASPCRKILSLKSDNIEIIGWVEDIRTYYSKAKIFVAPLKIGAGLQNKLLEAMAMELPSITTKLVQNGIGASLNNPLLIAETPEEFASSIIKLLEDPDTANRLGKNARQYVLNNYNWDIVEKKLSSIFSDE